MVSHPPLREGQGEKRKQGEDIGIGLSTYLGICGLGPAVATTAAAGIGFWGMAVLNLHFTRKATLVIGSSPHGQGHETPFAQIVGETICLPQVGIVRVHAGTAIRPIRIVTYVIRTAALAGTT